jgi:signal transduction histidine kinase
VGLALVKHIAEAHGGRVSVNSRHDSGSRFTLHLPLRS